MEKFDLENFPTSPSAKRMLSYVSDGFYDESYVGKWIFQVMGEEYDKARDIAVDLPAQFYPETATWGLTYHEIKWGLPVRQDLSYEERRKLIFQKRDYRAPMTPYCMEKHLENAIGYKVVVCDIHDSASAECHPNEFIVKIIGEGNIDTTIARQVLDRIKQSHTVYEIIIEMPMVGNIKIAAYMQEADIIMIKQRSL